MPTPHNRAVAGDYAEAVLLPGDPLRAKWVAETFLEGAKLVNDVRNCLGYTGTWKGKRVSVVSTLQTQPPMIADELRRQADQFVDLADFEDQVGRSANGRGPREGARSHPARGPIQSSRDSTYFGDDDLAEEEV